MEQSLLDVSSLLLGRRACPIVVGSAVVCIGPKAQRVHIARKLREKERVDEVVPSHIFDTLTTDCLTAEVKSSSLMVSCAHLRTCMPSPRAVFVRNDRTQRLADIDTALDSYVVDQDGLQDIFVHPEPKKPKEKQTKKDRY